MKFNIRQIMAATLMIAVAAFEAQALQLPAIVGKGMVLQQQSDAALWGWAKPGSQVEVSTSWNGRTYKARAAKSGRWDVKVATPEASYTGYTVTVKGDGQTVEIPDVLIGEVWFASGQSNMEMPLEGFIGSPVDGSNDAIAGAGKHRHAIRFSTTPRARPVEPADSVGGPWQECTSANAPKFSAMAYFFARKLNDLIDVPVGIINCSYGGTSVEGWIPKEICETYTDIDMKQAYDPKGIECFQPMVMYNGMLYPLAGYTIRGFLWNQGESNVGRHTTYAAHLADMVAHWRKLWGDADASLPFYTVEIPPFSYGDEAGVAAALIREAQEKAMDIIPNSAMISSIDLATPGLSCQIHPSVKREGGERLAYLAAVRQYGVEGVRCESPKMAKVEFDGATAMIRFDNAVDGLSPYQGMQGFEVAGADKVFHPAVAEQVFGPFPVVEGVRVSSPEVDKIEAVRYCFHNWCIGSVYGTRQLPLKPFRTDSW